MPKKKKEETLEDIIERMEEDLNTLRHMVWDMQCENKSSDDEDEEDFDDEDNDDEEDE
tara:strand:- start:2021 stop:2194 length:174 start_codon:yes stop_codon:yes gene_type:complete